MAESIDPCAPKVAFWTKKHDFRHPFSHRFFGFFRKWQKCEINEEYNAKRGSEPLKTFDFRIDFSCNFNTFSKLTPRHHFSRVKVPVYAHKYDFWLIFDCPKVPKTTLGATFSAQEAPKRWVPFPGLSVLEPTWSRFSADNAPRTHFHRSGVVFQFDFGRIFQQF